jgi:nickel-dependent lactate racemase
MHVELLYGEGTLPVEIDVGWRADVLKKQQMPVLSDALAAVGQALAEPVGTPPLHLRAQGAGSACILICDVTRPVPNRVILPPLIRTLLDADLAPEAITVLVATGLHPPNEGEELRRVVGNDWVLETVSVVNHFARDDAAHVHVGNTSRGNVVRLDKRFVEADLRIVTGLVEPHFMAGYSGGRKVVAPGIAHAETITTLHSARYMEDPNADNGVLEGNPLHQDQLEIVGMVGGILAVNAVIDGARRLSFVNFGEIIESHLQAVAFTRPFVELKVPRRYRTVVTSSAGYPLDSTYYQTVKGMVGPLGVLELGGTLIVASECAKGMGSDEFVDAQRRLLALGPDGFLDSLLAKRQAAVDEWQTEKQLKPMRAGRVRLYTSGLTGEDRALTGVEMIYSVGDAIAESVGATGDPHVAFVPEGPYVVPQYAR